MIVIPQQRKEPVKLAYTVDAGAKRDFDAMAMRAGVSKARFFEYVVQHLTEELTDRGVPNWFPQPEPDDGELPIDIT
ncbi:MAG: hypothetical protein ACTH8F_08310 [Microbacterium sp.]|uniref:hypothetical protein n=1 Tax=Microbacterium sp. TaxID=51671 RepID=UPI003F95739F